MSTVFAPYSARVYRQDIQGVRAIGAVLIMIYHIWLNRVSGGVDVFFVVSGFFMASLLLRQAAIEGVIRPFVFWGKIIKRIAPSAYTILLLTLLLGYLFIPETRWLDLVNQTIFSALHLENIHLMHSSVDYLAREEPPSAVQQFWALSIQIQFYALLPLAFMAGCALSKKFRSICPLMAVVGGIVMLSFFYSLSITAKTPDSAYFNPFARTWEFFLGVLVAMLLPYLKIGRNWRDLIGFIGLVALLACGLVVPDTMHYPGYVSLLPVTAAILLILSGSEGDNSRIGRFLSNRYFAFLGGISFSIYLWHWPLLVFYLDSTGASQVSIPGGLLIIAGALVLAVISKRFIEDAFRTPRTEKQDPRVAYLIGVLFFVPAIATPAAWKLHVHSLLQRDLALPYFEMTSIQAQYDARDIPFAQFVRVKTVLPESYPDSCHQKAARPEVIICAYGDTKASSSIALVGGSHATQWLPALDTIGRSLNLKILNITKSYCPLGALENSHPSCVEWNKRVIRKLIELRPLVVITNSTRSALGELDEYVPPAYVAQWQLLADHGLGVIGIRDNPQFPFDVAHCIARNKDNPLTCSKPRTEALLKVDPTLQYRDKLSNLELVDMSDFLCTPDTCTTVFNNTLMYRDKAHLSVPYVNFLTLKLHERLAAASPDIFRKQLSAKALWANK